jgi:adenylate cyclase
MKTLSGKHRRSILRDHWIGWTFAFSLFLVLRRVGTRELSGLDFSIPTIIAMVAVFGTVFGLISGFATSFFSEQFYKRTSLIKFLTARGLFAIAFVLAIFLVMFIVQGIVFGESSFTIIEFFTQPVFVVILLYLIMVDSALAIFGQLSLMIGRGNVSKLIRGEFYEPKEEARIFMFLDLRSSTKIAEELGHLEYSKLIQDCFNDLAIMEKYDSEIYQYVGDEVVLSWAVNPSKNIDCIKAYYAFMGLIKQRETYYLENYGRVPFFKAGIHMGKITVSEVGKYKREIAYHGDTINTASRIQGLCNQLEAELLISDKFKKSLADEQGFSFTPKGIHALKGKENTIELWSVSSGY